MNARGPTASTRCRAPTPATTGTPIQATTIPTATRTETGLRDGGQLPIYGRLEGGRKDGKTESCRGDTGAGAIDGPTFRPSVFPSFRPIRGYSCRLETSPSSPTPPDRT